MDAQAGVLSSVETTNRGRTRSNFFSSEYGPHAMFLYEAAFESGFKIAPEQNITTQKGLWRVLERPGYKLPIFPSGEDITYAMLAGYEPKVSEAFVARSAVLRISRQEFPKDQFIEDVQRISKYFFERKGVYGTITGFFGVGKRSVAGSHGFLLGYAITGATTGLAAAAAGASPEAALRIGIYSGVAGAIAGAFSFQQVKNRLEASAIRKAGCIEDYVVGSKGAHDVLLRERQSEERITMLRDFYAALKAEGSRLTPELFLTHMIWETASRALRIRREVESQAAVELERTVGVEGRRVIDILDEVIPRHLRQWD